ncbi:hypothetical protein [Ancylobacter terrae]|uniref:hypothetical protein n=1 Tax=Ancylobacter sp. sgz301288 TaxID=3342077 RepID=UPI00385B7CBB
MIDGVPKHGIRLQNEILDIYIPAINWEDAHIRRQVSSLTAYKEEGGARYIIQALRKSSLWGWKFEMHFSLNWYDIWKIVNIDRPDIKDKDYKYMALLSTGTACYHDVYDSLEFHDGVSVDLIARRMIAFHNDVAVPFFRRWGDIRANAEAFFNSTPEAEIVALLPSRLAKMAVAIAIIDHDKDFALSMIEKQTKYLEPKHVTNRNEFQDFVAVLREKHMI